MAWISAVAARAEKYSLFAYPDAFQIVLHHEESDAEVEVCSVALVLAQLLLHAAIVPKLEVQVVAGGAAVSNACCGVHAVVENGGRPRGAGEGCHRQHDGSCGRDHGG